jgi:hypothetical protein
MRISGTGLDLNTPILENKPDFIRRAKRIINRFRN